jgi:hypothetical protein
MDIALLLKGQRGDMQRSLTKLRQSGAVSELHFMNLELLILKPTT